MEKKTEELIQVKKTKFVEMYYLEKNKTLYMKTFGIYGVEELILIPINKIPQVIRGLFSAYCRFHGKKKRS